MDHLAPICSPSQIDPFLLSSSFLLHPISLLAHASLSCTVRCRHQDLSHPLRKTFHGLGFGLSSGQASLLQAPCRSLVKLSGSILLSLQTLPGFSLFLPQFPGRISPILAPPHFGTGSLPLPLLHLLLLLCYLLHPPSDRWERILPHLFDYRCLHKKH